MNVFRPNKKTLAPITRSRARFCYDDLFRYLVNTDLLLESGGDLCLRLPEVTLFITRLKHLSVLDDDAQAAVEVNYLQQPLHGCGEYFRRAHFPAELHEASFFVFRTLRFYHG